MTPLRWAIDKFISSIIGIEFKSEVGVPLLELGSDFRQVASGVAVL